MSTSTNSKRIKWTVKHWHAIFEQVQKAREIQGRSTVITIEAGLATDLRPIEVKFAQQVVFAEYPELQRKHIHNAQAIWPAAKALEVFYTGPELKFESKSLPEVEFKSEPAATSTTVPADVVEVTASVQHERRKHVRWGEHEWDKVAAELIKRRPETMLLSTTLAGITASDVASAAQAALEQRPPVLSMVKTRELLLAAAERHKAKEENKAAEKAEAERITRVEAAEAEAEAKRAAQPREESAADVLMRNFASEVAKQLLPQMISALEATLLPKIEGMFAVMFERLAAPDSKHEEHHPMTFKDIGLPRKLRIAVVGIESVTEKKLELQFPDVKFVTTGRDPRNVGETVRNCDLVICAINGVSHSTAKSVERAAGDRYRRVAGGETTIIRTVQMWCASQPNAAAAH